MRTNLQIFSPAPTLGWGNSILDYARIITPFVITVFKHLFCLPQSPVLCQGGKQTRCVPDEYSNVLFLVSVIPDANPSAVPQKFGPNCLIVRLGNG